MGDNQQTWIEIYQAFRESVESNNPISQLEAHKIAKTLTDEYRKETDYSRKYVLHELIQKFLNVSIIDPLFTQTVIIPDFKTAEGILVKAADFFWFEIAKLIQENPELRFKLPWRTFEEFIAGMYKRAGFDEVVLTERSGDHGIDVIAVTKKGYGELRFVDQVKCLGPGKVVTANDVRALSGVLLGMPNATKGFVTTTAEFAPMIETDPYLAPLMPSRLELRNGKRLVESLASLISADGKSLILNW